MTDYLTKLFREKEFSFSHQIGGKTVTQKEVETFLLKNTLPKQVELDLRACESVTDFEQFFFQIAQVIVS